MGRRAGESKVFELEAVPIFFPCELAWLGRGRLDESVVQREGLCASFAKQDQTYQYELSLPVTSKSKTSASNSNAPGRSSGPSSTLP